jgi:hypothetical protein
MSFYPPVIVDNSQYYRIKVADQLYTDARLYSYTRFRHGLASYTLSDKNQG